MKQSGRKEKIILIVCIVVFLYSAFQLVQYYYKTQTAKKEFQTIEEIAFQKEKSDDSAYEEKEESGEISHYKALQKENEDCIGWVQYRRNTN